MTMRSRGESRIDPGSLPSNGVRKEMTDPSTAGAVLERTAALSAGRNTRVALRPSSTVPARDGHQVVLMHVK